MTAPRRRTVIAGSAAVAATAGSGVATASTAHAAKAPTELLTRSRFSPLVGKAFTMSSTTGRWSVVLTAVDDLVPGGAPGAEKQFAATFSASGGGVTDGIYSFSRNGFTTTTLFVVADAAGRHSRGTVNRV